MLGCLAGVALSACMREDLEMSYAPQVPEGAVVLDGTLSLPATEDSRPATKAFGEPDEVLVKRLYLAVFDDSDVLYEVASALPGTQARPTGLEGGFVCGDEASGFLTPFYVQLTAVPQKNRYIHFIAVSEPHETLERAVRGIFDPMDEAAFVRNLVTEGTDIAYWGRTQVTSITQYTRFREIPMIRNFAKVQVSVDPGVTNFTLLGFKVFDAPNMGAIAPFNNSTADYTTSGNLQQINFNRFADYQQASQRSDPYTWLTVEDGYHGFLPTGYAYDNLSTHYTTSGDTMDADGMWVSPSGSDYLYECSYRPERNPFIIMKARYNDGNTTDTYYYKADFVYRNADIGVTEYYDILRNFLYTFQVTSVNGKGSNTVYDAVNTIALNNLQGSTLARGLTSVASGDSQLYVSQTSALIIDGSTFTLYVKSLTGEGLSVDNTSSVTASPLDATGGGSVVTAAITINPTAEASGTYAGWHAVTIPIADASKMKAGAVWKQSVVFKNPAGLVRQLDLTLRRPMQLTVDATDVVPGVQDSACDVKITIPAGIEEANFPLYFYIEQEQNTLYPEALAAGSAAALTVESGPSKIPGNASRNGYYFLRTITWDEYRPMSITDVNGMKTFSCRFKSIKAASATTVWVIPDEQNAYFDLFDDIENVYTNKDSFLNTKLTGEVKFAYEGLQLAPGGTALVPATSNSGGTITYSSSNTSVARVDATGKVTAVALGNATITASVPEAGSYTAASKSYSVAVVDESALCGLDLQWEHEPSYVIQLNQQIHAPLAVATAAEGYDLANVTIDYTTSPSGRITVTNEATAESDGYVNIRGDAVGTVRVTATATAASADGKTGTSRTIYVDVKVVSGHPEAGTVYHDETFLGATLGDYTILAERVSNGATYSAGTDVTALFNTYTTYNVGTGYDPRHVWYPYYNKARKEGYGAAASGYGSIEAATGRYNPETTNMAWDYHNRSYASHVQLASKEFDLSASGGATLIFEHAGNYFYNTVTSVDVANAQTIMQGDARVYISKDGGSNWTQATVKYYPSGDSWVFERTAVDIPADYCTSRFRLLFDYTSIGGTLIQKTDNEAHPLYYEYDAENERILTTETTETTDYPVMIVNPENPGRAGTWEIRNVQIKERVIYD